MGNTELLLEYQRLDNKGDKLESLDYSEEIQSLLEEIGERQIEILNQIYIQ